MNFDYAMAKGLKKSFKKFYRQNLAKALELICDIEGHTAAVKELSKGIEAETGLFPRMKDGSGESERYLDCEKPILMAKYGIGDKECGKCQRFAMKYAEKESDRASYQAMEALIHNLNTMHSRAGAQVSQ